jgi:hypothetical protein
LNSFDTFVYFISGGFAFLYWIFWISVYIFFLALLWQLILATFVHTGTLFNWLLRMLDLDWRDRSIESPYLVCDNLRRSLLELDGDISSEDLASIELLLRETLNAILYADTHNIYTPPNLQAAAASIKKSNDSLFLAYFRGRCSYVQSIIYNYPSVFSRYRVNQIWLHDMLLAFQYLEKLKACHKATTTSHQQDILSLGVQVSNAKIENGNLLVDLMRARQEIECKDLEVEELKLELSLLNQNASQTSGVNSEQETDLSKEFTEKK